MMYRPIFALILLAGMGTMTAAETPTAEPTPPTEPTPALPDALANAWVQTLRRNDLSGAYALLTAPDREMLAKHWQRQMKRANVFLDMQIDTLLRLSKNAEAADQLVAISQPFLAQIDIAKATKGLLDIAGFLGTAADAKQPGSGGLDYDGLRTWLTDLAAWMPTAGFTNQAKAKLTAGHLVRVFSTSSIQSAAELRAMPLEELLVKLGPALPAFKEALAVYDLQVDALLESFTAKLGAIESDHTTVELGFTSLEKPRTITLKLVQQNGAWQLASGNDNPLTGLSQLLMMAMLMQGMDGETPTPPAKPVSVPEDDGAL